MVKVYLLKAADRLRRDKLFKFINNKYRILLYMLSPYNGDSETVSLMLSLFFLQKLYQFKFLVLNYESFLCRKS